MLNIMQINVAKIQWKIFNKLRARAATVVCTQSLRIGQVSFCLNAKLKTIFQDHRPERTAC